MTRSAYQFNVRTETGDVVPAAEVMVREPGISAEVPVYAAPTGGSVLVQPLIGSGSGFIKFYADPVICDVTAKDPITFTEMTWTNVEIGLARKEIEDDGAIKEIANPEDYDGIINVVTSSYSFTQVTDDHTEYVYLGRLSPGVTEFRISDDTTTNNVNAALAISLEKNSSVGTSTSHKGVSVLSFLPSISFVALQSVHTKFIDADTADIFGKFTIGAEVIQVPSILAADHPDLLAFWDFDSVSGSTVFDVSGNGNDGEKTGVDIVSGIVGNAGDFTHNSFVSSPAVDYISINGGAGIILVGDFGFSFFFRDSENISSRSVVCGSDVYPDNYMEVSANSGGWQPVYSLDGNATFTPFGTEDRSWHHLVFNRIGSDVSVYYHGAFQESLPANAVDFIVAYIGTYKDPPNTSSLHCKMLLDQLRFFNRALTPQEVTDLAAELTASNEASLNVINPGAESGSTGWIAETGGFVTVLPGGGLGPHSGSNTFASSFNVSFSRIYQDIPYSIAGNTVVLDYWAGILSITEAGDTVKMTLRFLNASDEIIGVEKEAPYIADIYEVWEAQTVSDTVPVGCEKIRITMQFQRGPTGSQNNAYLDDITLTALTSPVAEVNHTIEIAGYDTGNTYARPEGIVSPVLTASNETLLPLSGPFLGLTAKAADSELLDGLDSTEFAAAAHDHNGEYLGVADKAEDSALLDGEPSSSFLTTTGTAADSDKLDGQHASEFASLGHGHGSTYLGVNETAADSDKLGGQLASAFVSITSGSNANGSWREYGDGFKVQWGTVPVRTDRYTEPVVFPVAFSSTGYSVHVQLIADGTSNDDEGFIFGKTTIDFHVRSLGTGDWFAMGY